MNTLVFDDGDFLMALCTITGHRRPQVRQTRRHKRIRVERLRRQRYRFLVRAGITW